MFTLLRSNTVDSKSIFKDQNFELGPRPFHISYAKLTQALQKKQGLHLILFFFQVVFFDELIENVKKMLLGKNCENKVKIVNSVNKKINYCPK